MDRIVEAVVTDETAERPADLDLGETWPDVVSEVDEQRHRAWATVVVSPVVLSFLRNRFGEQAVTAERIDGDRLRASGRAGQRARCPRPGRMGDQIDVLGPDDVRADLSRIGAELVEHNPAGRDP